LNVELTASGPGRGAELIQAAEAAGTWWAFYRAATVLGREGAAETAQAWAWCRNHQAQGTSAFLDDVPTVRLYTAGAGDAAKSQ
jgi:hypothetical protein